MQDSQQPVTSNTHFKIAKKNMFDSEVEVSKTSDRPLRKYMSCVGSSEAALSVCQPLTNKKRQLTWDRAIVLISIATESPR